MKQRATKAALPVPEEALADRARIVEAAPLAARIALLSQLRTLLPPARLVISAEDLFAYECDAQTFDRGLPLAVVFPETTAEVAEIVRACAAHGVAFLPRGAGTGLSGGAVATGSMRSRPRA